MILNKIDRTVITLGKQTAHSKCVLGLPPPVETEFYEESATSRNIIREVSRSLMAR